MKFLNLIRHGNSESDFLKNDFDRELDQVGHNNCKNLDSFLYRYSFKKHKILCSSSKRTSQTLESLRFSLNENSKIIYDENIYQTDGLPSDYGKGTRTSNLRANFDDGVTFEFWLKKDEFDTSKTDASAVFVMDILTAFLPLNPITFIDLHSSSTPASYPP